MNDPWWTDRTHPVWELAKIVVKGLIGSIVLGMVLWLNYNHFDPSRDFNTILYSLVGWLVTETATEAFSKKAGG